ncbi:unnamed protein product [Candida verbasci]|uniref:Spindle pole body-associated protein Vik1/Cik1 microtubule binding domain-containing protein n=1 Tax=Candida verbasci TaxID=1227364 RepID=A0A9W4TX52_9ASCO|nr:unnamed protein product [Candida verbasci]
MPTSTTTKRRQSLGFEIASIKHQQPTKIPTINLPPPSTTSSSRSLPNDFQDRILTIQDRLKRKGQVNDNINKPKEYKPRKSGFLVSNNELQQKYYGLNDEYKEKLKKIEDLSSELKGLKLIHRNYQSKIEILMGQYQSNMNLIEDYEMQIIKNVENEEKMINLKLRENKIKLENQFKEFESVTNLEIQDAKSYNFENVINQIKVLKEEKEKLALSIKESKLSNDEKLKIENEKYEESIKLEIEPFVTKLNEIRTEILVKGAELTQLESIHASLMTDLESSQLEIRQLREEIGSIEKIMNSYHSTKLSYENESQELEQKIAVESQIDEKNQDNYNSIYQDYQEVSSKLEINENYRRNLENSIMQYENKFRIYIISSTSQNYNKNLSPKTPITFIIDEFSFFIKSVMKQNISIITNNIPSPILIKSIIQIIEKKNWTFELSYQSMIFNVIGKSVFKSDKIMIDDDCNITDSDEGVIIHTVHVKGSNTMKNIENRLTLIDFSKLNTVEQVQFLKRFDSDRVRVDEIDEVANSVVSNSKPIFVCAIDEQVDKFNEILQSLRGIECPYRIK